MIDPDGDGFPHEGLDYPLEWIEDTEKLEQMLENFREKNAEADN